MTKLLLKSVNVKPEIKNLTRTEITLINKTKTKLKYSPFFVLNPTIKKDMNLLCDYLTYLKKENISLKNLGGLSFRVFEHDFLVNEIKNKNQLDLNFKLLNESYLNLEKYFFKFIEPATSLYRNRYKDSIKK